RLAFLSDRANRGIAGVYVIPADGGEAAPLVARKRAISDLAWSPDGAHLAFLAPDEPTEDDERREKGRDDADVYGERRLNQHLHLLDIENGEVSQVATGDRHVAEVAWSPDGSRLGCVLWPAPEFESMLDAQVVVVSRAGGEPRPVCRQPAQALSWAAAGRLVFCGPHDPRGISGMTVWSVDPDGGVPVVIGTGREEGRCAVDLRAAPGAAGVAVVVAEGLATRIERRDATDGTCQGVVHECRGALSAFDVAETTLALVQANPDTPPEVFAGPPGDLRRLSDHHSELQDVRFGVVEEFEWPAPDGVRLDGVLVRPPDAGSMPLPAVVVPHGGPYGRSVPALELGWSAWATWLAGCGYAVLRPNYRGGLGRGHGFATAARGGVGGIEFSDVMSMVDAAVARGVADPARLGIGGWSQGGFLSAWAVTQTDRFRAAVVGAGPSDWDMMSATSDLPRFEAELVGSDPWDGPGPSSAAERSPIKYAARARTPVLILHGQEDKRVPVSQAVAWERALRAHRVPVQLVTYPREPHGIGELRHQRDVLARVRDWFDRWLGQTR
ncbi:MAG: S9 family peptidase, partial [Candidatus Dormibacteraceae bacterium]